MVNGGLTPLFLLDTKDGNSEILSSASYNGLHEPLTRTDAAGQVTHYYYNNQGQVTQVTTPLVETTYYNYDSRGFLISLVPPQLGAGVTFTYDGVGRVYTKSDAVNGTVVYHYDDGDRVTSVDYPDGTHESYAYNRLDLSGSTDRQGRLTSYTYDADRHKVTMTDPKMQLTQYGWCSCGSMTSITDPAMNKTSWDYDLEGRVKQKTYADGSFYTYQYDESGRLFQVTDANKQATEYVYDVDNKILNTNYFNVLGPTPNVSYQYDTLLGRLSGMTDGTGATSYSYGPIGQIGGNQIQTITQPVGTSTATIGYQYDADGRVASRSIDGVAESYYFNGVGQLHQVTNPLGQFGYTYDPASARLTEVDYPNFQKVEYDYFTPSNPLGASGSLKDITNLGGGSTSGQTLSKFSYTYAPTGDIKTWTQQLDNTPADAKTYSMGYDQDSELQGVTLASGTSGFDGLTANQSVTYGYDAAGNRTKEYTPSFDHSFGTNNLNQLTSIMPKPIHVQGSTDKPATVLVNSVQVSTDGSQGFVTDIASVAGNSTPLTIQAIASDGTTKTQTNHVLNTQPFIYDANGNLSADNTYTYTYDACNRLISVSYLSPQPPNVADNISFSYDGKGHRVEIVESHGSTVLTNKAFLWCDNRLFEERDSSGHAVTKRFYIWGEQISGTNYYYSKDHLGSVREVIDGSGVVQTKYDYDGFGRQAKISGSLDSDFGYTGFYVNRTTGFDLALYRAFDPEKGRWLNRDPIAEKGGLNLYAYVKDDPMDRVDPSGLAGSSSTDVQLGLFGYGDAKVSCCDQNKMRHQMRFEKVCIGVALGYTKSLSYVGGMDGGSCDPRNYEGWFLELGAGFVGASIGSSVGEVGVGGGIAVPVKATFCYYTLVYDKIIGKCCQ